ncbi:MAG TPA: hypothetical protein PK957_00800 [Candidatus Dojkabacteria bacterium]|nr:hypothetical protein [Candidatus Dojkabacteria bacterium]
MSILDTEINIFHEILKILGYSTEEQYKRVNDFIAIYQMTTVEKLLQICKNEGMSFHPGEIKNERDFNGLIEQISEIVGDKRVEQIVELMDDFVATVYPECNDEQKKRIDRLMI